MKRILPGRTIVPLCIVVLLTLLPEKGHAQMVVNDPVLQALEVKAGAERTVQTGNMVKQLSEAVQSTSELKKTTDLLKKNHERLTKINSAISNLSRLSYMIERQRNLISSSSKMVSELEGSDLFSVDEMNTLHSSLAKGIANTNDIVEMLDLVLKSKTKMSDSERMSLLRDLEKDFSERQTLLNKNIWEYQRIRNQRATRKALQAIHEKK